MRKCGLGRYTWTPPRNWGENVAEAYLHARPVEVEAKIWLKLSYMDTPRKLRWQCGWSLFTWALCENVGENVARAQLSHIEPQFDVHFQMVFMWTDLSHNFTSYLSKANRATVWLPLLKGVHVCSILRGFPCKANWATIWPPFSKGVHVNLIEPQFDPYLRRVSM